MCTYQTFTAGIWCILLALSRPRPKVLPALGGWVCYICYFKTSKSQQYPNHQPLRGRAPEQNTARRGGSPHPEPRPIRRLSLHPSVARRVEHHARHQRMVRVQRKDGVDLLARLPDTRLRSRVPPPSLSRTALFFLDSHYPTHTNAGTHHNTHEFFSPKWLSLVVPEKVEMAPARGSATMAEISLSSRQAVDTATWSSFRGLTVMVCLLC